MISRDLFIETMETLQKQQEHDIDFCNKLGKVFPNAYKADLIYDNSIIKSALIKLLNEVMGSKIVPEIGMSDIEFFCDYIIDNECEATCDAYSNAGELYDYLTDKNKKQ